MRNALAACAIVAVLSSLCPCFVRADDAAANPKEDGYRGIWFELGQKGKFGDKYSGGLGTYTANHAPMAIYAKDVNKTFFVFGGAKEGKQILQAMVSYYDHERDLVPRPTVVHDWQTADPPLREPNVNDPHDNPSLCIDGEGYVWIFVSGRNCFRLGLLYRGTKPYCIEKFELVRAWEATYPQPWWIESRGLLLLFTKYTAGRELYWSFSRNGTRWSNDNCFAGFGGHYQSSSLIGGSVITAFNVHPAGKLDERTNLYYLRTDDCGRTWKNVRGKAVQTPFDRIDNSAVVRDYLSEKRLVYIHDLNLDRQGRPLILNTTGGVKMPQFPRERSRGAFLFPLVPKTRSFPWSPSSAWEPIASTLRVGWQTSLAKFG